ncbi:MAG: MFS transporter, partial [Chloroflexota bacterium]
MASAAPSVAPTNRARGLGALTPSGRAIVPASWALYDFANTIFSFAVVSGAIGLYLNDQFGRRDGGVLLAVSVAVSVGINAIVSPILGALSDRGGRRMPFLLLFTVQCIAATFFIATVAPVLGLVLFVIANFSYQAALIYYDATLRTVSNAESRGRLSGIGTAIGYCGTVAVGLTIFLLDVPVVDRFRLAALFSAVCASPIFVFDREPRRADEPPMAARDVIESFGQLRLTIQHARTVPGLGRFLLGRFFYSDAVNTVIVVMSVVTTEALGVSDRDANTILLGLTIVAIAMSFVWGAMCDRIGPKRTLLVVLGSWAVGLVLGGISLGFGSSGLAPFLLAGAILGSGLGG